MVPQGRGSQGLELDPAAPAGCTGCSSQQPWASDSSLSVSPSAQKACDRCLCLPTAACWGLGRGLVPGATGLQVNRTVPCTCGAAPNGLHPGALHAYFRSFSRRDFELMLECGEARGAWRWVSAFRVWVWRCSPGGSRNAETTPSPPVVGAL